MGKTDREKAIYMTGMTFGTGFMALLFAYLSYGDHSRMAITGTGVIMGITLLLISLVWRNRANKAK